MAVLTLTLGATAALAAWRVSLDSLGLMEARISLVVFVICGTLAILQLLELIRCYYEDRAYRRWLGTAE